MKAKFKLGLLAVFGAATVCAQTVYQTGFNPQSPLDGQDAMIFSLNPNTNYGNYNDLYMGAWTYNGTPGITRSVIRFSDLAILASGHASRQVVNGVTTFEPITIVSAKLSMKAFQSGSPNWGSNYFPGTPLPNTNEAYIKRILSGKNNAYNNWQENTITWNIGQQMTYETATNWVTIPVTTDRYNSSADIDVTQMVQRIVNEMVGTSNVTYVNGVAHGFVLPPDPDANNGFMLQLQNENYYRSQIYAASDALTPTNYPRLTISYTNNEFPCDAGFGYFHNGGGDFTFEFCALAGPWVAVPTDIYEWYIDKPLNTTAAPDGTAWYLFQTFTPGTHTAWMKRNSSPGVECSRSGLITIYVAADGSFTQSPEMLSPNPVPGGYNPLQEGVGGTGYFDVNKPDNPLEVLKTSSRFLVNPNPTASDWTVSVNVFQSGTADIVLYDLSGRVISSETKSLVKGMNTFVTPGAELPAGVYFMELKGTGLSLKQKVIKK